MSRNPYHYVYLISFGLAAIAFAIDATGRLHGNFDAVGKMFVAIAFLFLLVS